MQRASIPTVALPLAVALAAAACSSGPAPLPLVPARPPIVQPIATTQRAMVGLRPEVADSLARATRASVSPTVMEGFQLSLWAPEQLIADPIGVSIDSLGRMYVTRTTRTNRSELEIRRHTDWMIESMTWRDVEDRRRFYMTTLAPERSAQNQWLADYNNDGSRDWRDLTVQKESLYRLQDTNGDGIADQSEVIVEEFNDVITDVAHDVRVFNNDVYLAVAPDLWRLRDMDGDGRIDSKEQIATGFDVHTGFGGHGLSGVIIGPDGRLYWKMSDRGFNVVSREGRRLASTHSGAILRSEPDGSDMEIFATGLRNPQEFAFDEYGNMLTADNDGDNPGEIERLVYITNGSDTGWRINWQFGKYLDPDNNTYRPWMAEGLFRPKHEGQAAYILPPIANYRAGPTGFVYNPGTALSDTWRDYFFLSTFTGSAGSAAVRAIQLREKGAGFELGQDQTITTGILVTGLEFGPEGALYALDWIQGWDPKDRGRIWKLDVTAPSPARAETQRLVAASFKERPVSELIPLMGHADQRVRQKAQFELAERGEADALVGVARQRTNQIARVHGIFGIAQLARKDARNARLLVPLLEDEDAEIRAQAAKWLGDVRYAPAADEIMPLLRDASPRARFFAAEALGRIAHRPAVQPIIGMLRENDDADATLRQAGATALARIGDAAALVALADDPSRALRTAAVVALRQLRDPGVARFLRDADEYVVAEAARAINDDESIEAALPALAQTLEDARFRGEPLLRRAINANLRVGTAEAAQRVAAFAVRAGAADSMKAEALAVLGVWPKPSVLDRVDGFPRGQMVRDSAIARAALAGIVEQLFASGSPLVQVAAADAAGRLRLTAAAPTLLAKVSSAPPQVKIAAVRALAQMGDARTEQAVRAALADTDPTVRTAALTLLGSTNISEAAKSEMLASLVERGTVAEQQAALAALGRQQGATGREVLTRLVDRLARGSIAPEIQLDLIEAARATNSEPLNASLARYEAGRANAAAAVAYSDAMSGGDARAGQRVFNQHAAAQCTRCHTVAAGTGANVGPNLAGVGSRLNRQELLEALVTPSSRIAPGFGAPGAPSAMPPMHGILSRREMRDVVEYLSSLK